MSAGVFQTARYELDSTNGGYVMRCRVQPETLSATFASVANAQAGGSVNAPGSAKASKGKREFGVGMRSVSIEFTGTPPTGYSDENVRIPVLDPDTYASWVLEATGTYLGVAAKIVGRTPESVV